LPGKYHLVILPRTWASRHNRSVVSVKTSAKNAFYHLLSVQRLRLRNFASTKKYDHEKAKRIFNRQKGGDIGR